MKILIPLILLISGCASQQVNDVELSAKHKALSSAHLMLSKGNAVGALNKHLKWLVNECEHELNNSNEILYVARSQIESFYLLLLATAENNNAKVIATPCAEGFYYMGYASLELGRIDDAEKYVKKAIKMSPLNALYSSELGHIYQVKKDWPLALTTFKKSEELANDFSPDSLKLIELSRAKRGVGFTLIELGRLNEAKNKFNECLDINPEDKIAKAELAYIKSIELNNGSK